MPSPRRVLAALACTAVLALAGTACGGGDSHSEASFCDALKTWQSTSASLDQDAKPGTAAYEDGTARISKAEPPAHDWRG